jgi:hypothetical protein
MTILKYLNLAGAIAGVVLITPVFAAGLTEADFDYLITQTVQKDGRLIQGLSPKEQARLHALINDVVTANDPIARAKDVSRVLADFNSHQVWEREHPGQLWDAPSRQIAK